ncbi:phosphate ABC transporter permease PstA [Altericista sp. CCNU0014]
MYLTRKSADARSILNSAMTVLSGALVVVALIPLLAVLSYVIVRGVSRLNLDLLTKLPPPPMVPGGGIANAIVGTLIMVGLASVISVPIGVGAAIFLSEFSNPTTARWIRFATNVLNGVPSIILGVFAYAALVITTGTFSAFAGAVALSILMLPTIIRTTDEALKIVPQEIRWAALGVGAAKYQAVMQIVVPAALPTIITGVTLAIARAAGETAPLIFTALFTQFWPNSLSQPTPSLAVLVFNFATVPFKNQQELAWAASLILVLLVLTTSIVSRLALRRKTY